MQTRELDIQSTPFRTFFLMLHGEPQIVLNLNFNKCVKNKEYLFLEFKKNTKKTT